jgi:hypothetical protein
MPSGVLARPGFVSAFALLAKDNLIPRAVAGGALKLAKSAVKVGHRGPQK